MTGKRQLLEEFLKPLDEEDTLSTTENRLRSLIHGATPEVSASIQEVLIPTTKLSLAMPVDVDASRYIPSETYDTLITDITDSDIMEIGNELQHSNLSDAVADGTFPVEGTFYGSNLRLFGPSPSGSGPRASIGASGSCSWSTPVPPSPSCGLTRLRSWASARAFQKARKL